jgi:hypothetical protein
MNLKFSFYILIILTSVCPSANAKWEKVSEADVSTAEKYIDMESVKQAGPMSIYRQVKILSQGPALNDKGFNSKIEIYEYDCMTNKLRILQELGYSKLWATGDASVIPVEQQAVREWHELPKSSIGLQTFNFLCPSGKDN